MNEQIQALIESLGDPTQDNEYRLHVQDGVWYLTHIHVGSGEPFRQFLEEFIK